MKPLLLVWFNGRIVTIYSMTCWAIIMNITDITKKARKTVIAQEYMFITIDINQTIQMTLML